MLDSVHNDALRICAGLSPVESLYTRGLHEPDLLLKTAKDSGISRIPVPPWTNFVELDMVGIGKRERPEGSDALYTKA